MNEKPVKDQVLLMFFFPFSFAVSRTFPSPCQLVESSKSEKTSPEISREGANDSEVKRMIKMLEKQTCSALQGKSAFMHVVTSNFI